MIVTDDVTQIVLTGELDISSANLVRDASTDLPPSERVVVDLRRLTFLDSTGLAALVELAKRSAPVAFRAGPPSVQKIFAVTDTMERFDWVSDAEHTA
jgi:anti-anti-sigma factor